VDSGSRELEHVIKITARCDPARRKWRSMSAHGEITPAAGKARAKILAFPRVTASQKRLLVPREHGAWALWLLPLITGGIVGCARGAAAAAPALWFSLVAIAAFLIRQPLESLLDVSIVRLRSAQERRVAVIWVIGLTAVAALGVMELVRLRRGLVLLIAVAALFCFALAALCRRARALRVAKQLIGALGLTSTAAGAYYVITGTLDSVALLLWLASWLFAAGQIEYVQLRLGTANARSRHDKIKAGWPLCLLHVAILAGAIAVSAAPHFPKFLPLAFAPAVIRIFVWIFSPVRPLKLYVLGFTELFQNIVFAALLALAFIAR
jgi:YwiC-like protein